MPIDRHPSGSRCTAVVVRSWSVRTPWPQRGARLEQNSTGGCYPATLSKVAPTRARGDGKRSRGRPGGSRGRDYTPERDGRTCYFVDEDTRREFGKGSAAR